MLRVTIKQALCVGAGMCVLSSSEVFDQGEDDGLVRLLQPNPPAHLWDQVRGAARKCPALAITVEDLPDSDAPLP